MWPDAFEDWYGPLGIGRRAYLEDYGEEWSIVVAGRLVAAGAEVHFVHPTVESPGSYLQRPSGAHVHFVRASPAYRAFRNFVWAHRWWERAQRLWPVAPLLSTLSWSLLGTLVRLRPDVVLVQDYESGRFDVAAPLLRAAGLRVVAIDTGASAAPSRMPWKRATAACAQRLLAAHEAEAARARRERGHRDVVVWPLPVRTDVFRPGDRATARARLGVPDDARLVLNVGRLHPVKGLRELAEACEALDCELVVIGAGPERDPLASRGNPRLRLPGRLGVDELPLWHAAANVFALASYQEGQPAVVMEAMACGRAVVATGVGGVPDVVDPGRTGWLVPPHDAGALRDALAEALADPDRADAMGALGRERVVERHSLEAAGEELARLLGVG
jgi:glycosyltransferase involved in cell wall biosynthesis